MQKATNPSGDSTEFEFTGAASGRIREGERIEVVVPAPGTYTSREAVPAAGDLKTIACNDSDSNGVVGTATATFRVISNERVTCTFTNSKRGVAHLVKTVRGAAPSGTQEFTFQLRQGATPIAVGTILETQTATAINGGIINFTTRS